MKSIFKIRRGQAPQDPRIDTPLGKIPVGPLAFAQGIARGESIEEIAGRLRLTAETVFGFRGFWRELLMRAPVAGATLDERICKLVADHGLARIDLAPDDLAEIRDAAPGQYGRD